MILIGAIITKLGSSVILLVASSICSIFGFGLSVYIFRKTRSIATILKKINTAKTYNEQHLLIRNTLKGHRDSIIDPKFGLDRKIVASISDQILAFDSEFNLLLNRYDRVRLWFLKLHLKRKFHKIDSHKLANQLTYIIARLKKEENDYEQQ